ncbi:MAG: hypothetical protein GY927_22475, partial [bacterium]|nr:hypothetical protein [bacterium]
GNFALDAGAQVNATALMTLENTVFSVQGGSTFTDGAPDPATTTYSSVGQFGSAGNGTSGYRTTNIDLMNVSGTGSSIDLSSVQSIDARVAPVAWTKNNQFITASDTGIIDLSGVEQISGPSNSNYKFEITSQAGGSIDMSSLNSVNSTGTGLLRINALDGGQLAVGDLQVNAANTVLQVDGGSLLQMKGLRAGTGAADITLNPSMATGPADVLDINGSADLGSSISITANKGSEVKISGDLSFAHISPSELLLGEAIVNFDGSSGLQLLEVGGTDVGTDVGFLADDNFGFGQFVVGTESQTSQVLLMDLIFNVSGGTDPESLYMFGIDGGDGLRILNGSTLFLGDLSAYAFLGAEGGMIDLLDLFPTGINKIAFDEGFIVASTVPVPPAIWLFGSAALGMFGWMKRKKET